MSDQQIEELTALAEAAAMTDLLPIVDVSDTTDDAGGTTKKITVANLLGASPHTTNSVVIAQSTHGLSVGNAVKHNGTAYVAAQADSAANAEVVGIVTDVADADTFTLTLGGKITGLSSLTSGAIYYLDPDTAGAYTTTEPSTSGDVIKPLFIATSPTEAVWLNLRGNLAGTYGCALRQDTTAQTIGASSVTKLNLNTVETDSSGAMADTANNRIVIVQSGWYIIRGFWTTTANVIDDGEFAQARIHIGNPTAVHATNYDRATANNVTAAPNVVSVVYLSAGDYVELHAFHNHSADTVQTRVDADGNKTRLTVVKVT